MESSSSEVKIQFKSFKKRPQRRRSRDESEEEGETEYNKEKYEETRELQKLRQVGSLGYFECDNDILWPAFTLIRFMEDLLDPDRLMGAVRIRN